RRSGSAAARNAGMPCHPGPVKRVWAVAAAAGLLTACSSGEHHALVRQAGGPTTTITAPPVPATTTTAPPATAAKARPGCPPIPARVAPAADRSRYTLNFRVDL